MPTVPADYRAPTDFPSLKGAKRIIYDIETCDPDLTEKGPGPRRDGYVAGIGISAYSDLSLEKPDFIQYYPVRHSWGPNCDWDHTWQWLRDQLNNYKGEL
ncbi:MAG: hypothetical protein KGL39_54250, partial [Patescibacteria group bacterium]|nr:hypothetical protein [Patescibacteria group bacterium]